jgi:hypothetical protein
MVYSSPQRSVSVRGRAEVIITHMPGTSDACEMHAQPVEKPIASLALRFCRHQLPSAISNLILSLLFTRLRLYKYALPENGCRHSKIQSSLLVNRGCMHVSHRTKPL